MTGLKVLSCGAGASVQDRGRSGYRRFGVSVAGAMDRRSLALANALVGNAPDAAAIELTLMGASFQVEGAGLVLAAAGPGVTLEIDGKRLAEGDTARAEPGVRVAVSPVRGGVYGYLAAAGGIRSEPEMGSRSLNHRAGIGGRALQAGDTLPCREAPADHGLPAARSLAAPSGGPIRIVPGPQDDHFTASAHAALVGGDYAIHPNSDRMGYRLIGAKLDHAGDGNIVSDGVLPGSVQVPGHGQPIVLMRDCQTTGGYPKIATVISADLDRLAQMPPGTPVRFSTVSVPEAVAAARQFQAELDALPAMLGQSSAATIRDRLFSENLITGATAGEDS